MARSWVIDGPTLAKKVINAGVRAHPIKDCGASALCPNCHYLIDNSNAHESPGFPAGVKFDPSDVELLHHLAAKRGVGQSEPHLFIDEFIPTLDGEEGICYTHPENLPGAKRDGSSVHFFYRTTNAYASGRRKRRRVQDQESSIKTRVRWHKTGKTKPVVENGLLKGFKKIMVLYGTSKRGSKPDKCNWVMHQFHLGTDENEKEGEYVVSKILYQPKKENLKNENPTLLMEEADIKAVPVIPMTPTTTTPDPPPRQDKTPFSESDDLIFQLYHQSQEPCHASYGTWLEDDDYTSCMDTNTKVLGYNPYHLGTNEDKKEQEFVVSNVLHQHEETFKNEHPALVVEESDIKAIPVNPMTPKMTTPDPPRQDQTPYSNGISEDYFLQSFLQTEDVHEPYRASVSRLECDDYTACFDTNTIVVDLSGESSLLCNEIMESYGAFDDLGPNYPSSTQVNSDINGVHERDAYALAGIGELDDLELDTPPDFQLTDLQFPSQDSVFDIVERM